MSNLPAPVRVSPLIKFGRWSLLSVGIVYGAFHQSRLSRKEAAIREVELKQKAIRDEKLAAEKKLATEKEIAELEALAK
ncbi:hypothetical protein MTP99_015089 [Tenebrio molitor]|jgi:F-type H+-transporting ATPase subunit e|uniref:ATP synthase subunit e, mitochondrial n=1 Tax=Tenebrio molitor TaxID=7067 RepID=UPI001C39E03E|nr:hypothetical protein MTP99_015089 [Tenebrio molitor]CAH1373713.1 unnamed protein product [Tenebrio molitor]